jgi:hypothetical protein
MRTAGFTHLGHSYQTLPKCKSVCKAEAQDTRWRAEYLGMTFDEWIKYYQERFCKPLHS